MENSLLVSFELLLVFPFGCSYKCHLEKLAGLQLGQGTRKTTVYEKR